MEPTLGGQAVIEGVMMRGNGRVAVAVRRPDGTIHVEAHPVRPWAQRYPWLRLPLLRGTAVLAESLVAGYEALHSSSHVSAGEAEDVMSRGEVIGTLLVSLGLTLLLFVFLPLWAAGWLLGETQGPWLAAVEGGIRLFVFCLYLVLIARMQEIRRVFMYHGAEHKAINCYEAGEELTVAHVRRHSLIHKRCGTSFLLFVMLASLVVFALVSVEGQEMWQMILYRLLLLPVVAGLSYEWIRWTAASDHPVLQGLAAPGLWMQRLTTIEPDDGMIEVAIASVRAVLGMEAGTQDASA
jgi:uncharacterized protein YqhQ